MEWYKSEIADEPEVELVWYSRDGDEGSMEDWAAKEGFPWPAVKFRSLKKVKEISKHAGRGVPNYVLVDAENKVLATGSGASKAKIKELLGEG